jgi:hypothetical protein
MSVIDTQYDKTDNTVRLLDSYLKYEVVVNATEYEIVVSYFRTVCDNETIAQSFAAFLFRIASEAKQPALALLEQVKGVDKLELTSTMAYYMNSLKSKSTLYGFSMLPTPNQSVQRNIVV